MSGVRERGEASRGIACTIYTVPLYYDQCSLIILQELEGGPAS
jgi:hypothetical protein